MWASGRLTRRTMTFGPVGMTGSCSPGSALGGRLTVMCGGLHRRVSTGLGPLSVTAALNVGLLLFSCADMSSSTAWNSPAPVPCAGLDDQDHDRNRRPGVPPAQHLGNVRGPGRTRCVKLTLAGRPAGPSGVPRHAFFASRASASSPVRSGGPSLPCAPMLCRPPSRRRPEQRTVRPPHRITELLTTPTLWCICLRRGNRKQRPTRENAWR